MPSTYRVAIAEYDFARDGGTVGTKTLRVNDAIPAHSIICDARLDVRRSRLRNWRQVSEFCSVAAVLGPTAGFAPSALLVSTSSCPEMGKPLRI